MLTTSRAFSLGTILAVVIALAAPATANAAPPPVTATPLSTAAQHEITPEQLRLAVDELKAAQVPFTTQRVGEDTIETFVFENGFSFSVGQGPSETRLGGGQDSGGIYVLFNAFDQGLIIGGGAMALQGALCLLPGVGAALCVVFGAILLVASTALATNGICQGGREMKIYIGGNQGRCVYV
ncbi:hypothetical protein [Plantibacter sp. M259]|uniref:hypothetical protein n=1 Tax=Plantibacter sp. M259 TaxID=2583822 RepID=UPI001110DAF8|nr:hypothetical protein [Plantibacter sp. M259]